MTTLDGKPDPLPPSRAPEPAARLGSPRFGFFLAQGVVIIASVLVALAVDRIVMGLDERALERSYLEGLLEDFQAIEVTAEGASRGAASRDAAGAVVLSSQRGGDSTNRTGMELAKALVEAGWMIEVRFPRVTWDDMLGTGRLGLLHDSELREDVAGFYGRAEQWESFSRDWIEVAAEYGDIVRELITPELRVAISNEIIGYGEQAAAALAPDPTALSARMRAARGLEATLGDVLLINKVAARGYGDLAKDAREIQAMITAELQGS